MKLEAPARIAKAFWEIEAAIAERVITQLESELNSPTTALIPEDPREAYLRGVCLAKEILESHKAICDAACERVEKLGDRAA